jgi:hypothetical protein
LLAFYHIWGSLPLQTTLFLENNDQAKDKGLLSHPNNHKPAKKALPAPAMYTEKAEKRLRGGFDGF